MTQTSAQHERTLADWLRLIRDGWPALLALTALGALGGFALSATADIEYEANSPVIVSPARGFLDPQDASELPALAETVARLANTPGVLRATAENYADAAIDPSASSDRAQVATLEWVADRISTEVEADTAVINVRATAEAENDAVDLAAATAAALDEAVVEGQSAITDSDGDTGLRVVALESASNGQVAPRPLLSVVVGAMAGFIAGVTAAILLGSARRRLWSDDELAALLGAPVLGVVRRRRGGLVAEGSLQLDGVVRDSELGTVLVTGTSDSGRIAAVSELVMRTLEARGAESSVLVDADTRLRSASRMFGLSENPDSQPSSVSVRSPADPSVSLAVLPAPKPPDGESANSFLFDELRRLRHGGISVVVVAPGLERQAELAPLLHESDAVVLVVDRGATRKQLRAVARLGPALSERLTGVVLFK